MRIKVILGNTFLHNFRYDIKEERRKICKTFYIKKGILEYMEFQNISLIKYSRTVKLNS